MFDWYTTMFQSTHPRGVRPALAPDVDGWIVFQSTHPRGVRLAVFHLPAQLVRVSIHAPARGATAVLILRRACWIWFQSTHPRGVRPGTPPGTACPISCFNPRTREGCDIPSVLGYVGRPSFNPRTREGCDPAGPQAGSQPAGVSIHAPARGATLATVLAVCWGAGFNPRTREGCDQRLPRLPARISAGFNPRTREGCDSSGASSKELPRTFQSTHPRGVRLGSRYGDQSFQSSFNPRTREGCDHMDEQQGCLLLKFQSTHPRGVRQSASAWQSRSSQFQSTHPRGVRHASRVPQADCRLVSIHAPARGAT